MALVLRPGSYVRWLCPPLTNDSVRWFCPPVTGGNFVIGYLNCIPVKLLFRYQVIKSYSVFCFHHGSGPPARQLWKVVTFMPAFDYWLSQVVWPAYSVTAGHGLEQHMFWVILICDLISELNIWSWVLFCRGGKMYLIVKTLEKKPFYILT